jgi:hypothetical protein
MRTDRRTGRWKLAALAVIAAAVAAGCQDQDVGQPCSPKVFGLDGGTPDACSNLPTSDTADYFESGPTTGCENLVCIHSAGEGCSSAADGGSTLNGECSKPCVSDADCFKDQTGMVCRQVVLSDAFIKDLQQTQEGQQILQRYLQNIQSSNFCAAPVQ